MRHQYTYKRSCVRRRWMFYAVWSPFTWLVGYVDPRKPSDDVLHGEGCRVCMHGMHGQHVQPQPASSPACA